jgi:magnesium-transporting ATPase (P-type)
MTMLGLVGMRDPIRKEVPAAMARCAQAGIRVMMLTGDHPQTASSIAREIGLGDQEAVLGADALAMDPAARRECVRTHQVYARVSPKGKLLLVEELLAQGEIVAMTGDGVNDAAALKKVHVGVAMGSGTAVAIEASDLVLLDDNFATLVTAISVGRGVYANVQRFIAFLFSGNFGVVVAMFLGLVFAGVFGLKEHHQLVVPLIAAQILWMNLVADGAPAVAFALGRSPDDGMSVPPRILHRPRRSQPGLRPHGRVLPGGHGPALERHEFSLPARHGAEPGVLPRLLGFRRLPALVGDDGDGAGRAAAPHPVRTGAARLAYLLAFDRGRTFDPGAGRNSQAAGADPVIFAIPET